MKLIPFHVSSSTRLPCRHHVIAIHSAPPLPPAGQSQMALLPIRPIQSYYSIQRNYFLGNSLKVIACSKSCRWTCLVITVSNNSTVLINTSTTCRWIDFKISFVEQQLSGARILSIALITNRFHLSLFLYPCPSSSASDCHLCRKSCWSIESGERDQPNSVVQADNAGLQRRRTVQHNQGLARNRQDNLRYAGVHAPAGLAFRQR